MTDQEIARLGSAFASYLGRYRACFLQRRTATHFDNLLSGVAQRFVGEVPVSFSPMTAKEDQPQRADAVLSAEDARRGQLYRFPALDPGTRRLPADLREAA